VRARLAAAEISSGPVFRGKVSDDALADHSAARIVKRYDQRVSRHKSLDPLRGYVRRVDLFKEHAGAAFL
jgi:hypothetical protein